MCRARAATPLAYSPSLSKPSAARSIGPSLDPYLLTSTTAPRHVSGKPAASRHCRPTASALVGAARATPARQLTPGALPRSSASSYRHPQPRHGALQAIERQSPASLSTAAEPTSLPYKRRPWTRSDTQSTSGHPHSIPTASNRREEAVFPDSGRFGRRHAPASCIATRAFPAHPAPPTYPSQPYGAAQPPKHGREPP